MFTSDAARTLSLTATSISRASIQLEDFGLIRTERRGVQKVIYSDESPSELYERAKNFLLNPVKRTIYVPKKEIKEKLLLSGYSALSEYSMLNPSSTEYFAAESVSAWNKYSSDRLHNADMQCVVELWRYDPEKLSKGDHVDRLSLALALRDDRDERVEETVEDMLNQLWREIDGKRI